MRNNKANPLYNSNWYNLMEGDHIVLIFGITCASLAIGAYVLFGPNFGNRKKTPVLGLQNLGQTCFMNTILQALGSCPIFIKWLDSQSQSLGEVGHALRNILFRLGQVGSKEASEHSIQPLEFMSVLSQHGWQMNLYNNIQQDAHELMTFILSKIEDEIFLNTKNQRNGLSWLDTESRLEEDGISNREMSASLSQSSVSLGACPSGDTGRRENFLKMRRTLSLHNTNMQTACATTFRGRLASQIRCAVCGHENPLKFDNFDSLSLHLPLKSSIGQSHTLQGLLEEFVNTEIINEFECDMCNKSIREPPTSGDSLAVSALHLDSMDISPASMNAESTRLNSMDNASTSRPAGVNDPGGIIDDLADSMNSSSAVVDFNRTLEKDFDASSETEVDVPNMGPIPDGETSESGVGPFIRSELGTHRIPRESDVRPKEPDDPAIPGDSPVMSIPVPPTPRKKVLCDAVRTLRIGKLPPCLCFHIHRTFYSSSGAYKRADYVDFPEYLVMDPYTYNSSLREREVKKQLVTRLNGAFPHDANGMDSNRWARASNVYRLKAVVVHRGSAEDGHFVTFRRGPISSLSRHRSLHSSLSFESRWYFTSDADIRESSLAEALKSAAYMLFYERCSPALIANERCNGATEPREESNGRLTNGHCIT